MARINNRFSYLDGFGSGALDRNPNGDHWSIFRSADSPLSNLSATAAAQSAQPGPVSILIPGPIFSALPAHALASGNFSQDWSNTGQITINDDWSGVPAIVGFRTADVTSSTGVLATSITTDTGFVVNVFANSTSTNTSGGVIEAETGAALGTPVNPTIALQGSNANDYAAIVIYLDSSTRQDVRLTANIRDIDSSADNAAQQVVVQYRIGSTGAWTNVAGGYYADVTTAGSATQITAVDLTLPADANNQSDLQIRILTTNAAGNDELIGIDDIVVSSNPSAGGETQTVQFNPVSVTQNEGNSGTTAYTFTVTRTGGTTGQLDFSGTIAAGTTDGTDFVGGSVPTVFSGSILAGQTSATVTVNVQGDATIEADESFTLTLTTASNTDGTVTTNIGANDDATGTITNDDTPVISIANAQDTEVDPPNTKDMVFIVTLSTAPTSGFVTVDFTTVDGTALATTTGLDNDYVTTTGQVVFGVGETMKEIRVPVRGDLDDESDESFSIVLSNPVGGVIGTGTATGTIIDNDVTQAVSIADSAIVEGDNGVTYLSFTVSLAAPAAGTITVDFATADGSATAGQDYLPVSGQVSFAAGETSKTILIPVIGDDLSEANETLTVTLSNAVGAAIGDGAATGTITNDDGPQYFSLASGDFEERWTDTSRISTNDNWSDVDYIIGYLGDIDAASPTNVDPRTLTGPNLGAVDVIANLANTTSNSGGVGEFHLTDPVVGLQGSGTADAPSLVLYMDATGRSDIRLQANLRDIDNSAPGGTEDNAAQQINVQYRTSPGGSWTNVPGAYFSDVTALGATQVTALDVILPPGANGAATLEIRIMTVNAAGNDEWVGIDDIVVSSLISPPSLSISNAAVFEGDAGATPITFTVTRNGSSLGAVTANYTVSFGNGPFDANAADFVAGQAFTGLVSFADGQTSQTITLNVQGDLNPEGDDNFTVTLSNAVGGTIADGSATGTIVNDDGLPPLVTINDVTVVEGDAGTSLMTFTVTRTGGTGAFSVDYATADGSATAGEDYVATGGTLNFADGEMSQTISVTINGDVDSELSETLQILLSNATNNALITDGIGVGTIASDDPIFIHDIQGTSYFSPILAAEGINSFNVASSATVIVRAIVTAVDNVGPRQGYYITEELIDWDGNTYTSEGIFVMTRNDAGIGSVVSGVSVGDLVQLTANVMEYQAFSSMPRTVLVNPTGFSVISTGNSLTALTVTLTNMPNEVLTGVTPDYFDSSDGAGDTFDASVYALSYFETVEGMLVTIPDMVVADGFVSTSGGRPILQAYSLASANPDQLNSRGGYTIAGDPPIGPPDTPETGDDTNHGGRHLHDGDVNPDIVELDFTDFATAPPAGLLQNATMGDQLGDVTGIIDFDFTDRKLFVTGMEPGGFVNGGIPERETTALGADPRSLTVATFNVENLDALDSPTKFAGLADAIANNLNSPDIICIEEIQDNNGPGAGSRDASLTWQMLVDAVNAATGKNYQWVDEEPNGSEGGEGGGNIRVGFLYNTDRVQLGDLDANATLAERRAYTDRIGDGVRDAGDLIAFSDDMAGAEINPSDWAGTRRSLLGEFTFNGNTVYVTANHFPAKGGSGEFWQVNQNLETGDPDNSGWAQRNQVSQDLYAMLNLIEGSGTGAGIVAGGDFNDFYFYRPLTTVTGYTMADGSARVGGARFDNLTLTLPEAERYTYTFDGRSQAIDHVIANNLLSDVATYDVVHINTGYNAQGTGPDASPRLSDHDPALSSFDFRDFNEVLDGTAAEDTIEGFGGNDIITGGEGDDLIDGGAGNDTAVYSGNASGYAITAEYDSSGDLIGFSQVSDLNGGDGNEGTDTLVSVETVVFADATFSAVDPVQLFDIDGNLVGTFTEIQAAIDAASGGGYTIKVAAGTYAENLVIGTNSLTILAEPGATLQGTFLADNGVSGPLNEWLKTAAAYDASAGAGITLSASSEVSITGLTITGFNQGIVLGDGTIGVTLNGVDLESNFTGIHKPGAAAVTDFEMLGGSITDGHLGMDVVRDSGSAGVFDGVVIDGVNFADLNRKGIYVEALSNAQLLNVTMSNVGEFGGILATGSLGAGGNGINLNLKYDDYANILIEHFTMTNVGSSDRDGAVADGHQNGGAIVITARDDAPSYSGDPATLSNVVIRNGSIDGTSTGIELGEPGKQNATPDVLVENVAVTNAQHSARHGEIGNQSGAVMTVEGTAGNDSLLASGNSDGAFVIHALDGNDTVAGGSAADTIDGGTGGDLLYGRDGADALVGGTGNDLVDGGAGIDSAAFAGAIGFNDTVIGWITASADGTDVLQNVEIAVDGDGQRNLLVGSTGFATLQAALNAAEAGDDVRLAAGTYSGIFNYSDAGLRVLAQPGATINATFTPSGSEGITVLAAGSVDHITTGAGNDLIDGGAGADTMTGGAGDDQYVVDNGGDIVNEAVGEGYDVVYAGVSYALAAGQSIDVLGTVNEAAATAINLTGNELDNYVTGNAGANTIDGGAGGVDQLWGRQGDDSYLVDSDDTVVEYAGHGYDIVYARASHTLSAGFEIEVLGTVDNTASTAIDLTGNELSNFVTGNAGDNVIDGGAGSDFLHGRGGADTFAFTTALGATNVDEILDFVSGTDKIGLDDAIFAGIGTPGSFDANAFVAGSAAADADDRIIYDQATGQLFYDADGNGAGAAVLFGLVSGLPSLTATDFTVI
jgi:uncharacterized protein